MTIWFQLIRSFTKVQLTQFDLDIQVQIELKSRQKVRPWLNKVSIEWIPNDINLINRLGHKRICVKAEIKTDVKTAKTNTKSIKNLHKLRPRFLQQSS